MRCRPLLTLSWLSLCAFMLGAPTFAQGDVPFIEWTDCPFDIPEGEAEGETLDCGVLITYEDHFDDEDDAQVELAFVILYARGESSPDPVLYLEGGPGGSALSSVDTWVESSARVDNDLILFDQRGTGYSWPSLNCIEVEVYDGDNPLEAEQACFDRLNDQDVNLNAYNSAQSVVDIAELIDLLQAEMAYELFNVMGISYGTRLALTVMRDEPETIRSVIIDSVYPPNRDVYEMQAVNQYRGLLMLFDGCAADPGCVQAYPDLEAVFYDIYVSLNESPAEYESIDSDTGEASDATLNGDGFLDLIIQSLYSTTAIPELPLVIYEVAEGNYAVVDLIDIGELSGRAAGPSMRQDGDIADSEAMFHAVECQEELPFNSLDDAVHESASIPDPIYDYLVASIEDQFLVCELYGLEPADAIETEAVESDIPTLVLAGDYDPITPPADARLAAESLSSSYYFEFHGYGHGVIDGGDCARSIVAEFLADPYIEPDRSCVDALQGPAFVIR